jgi:hypothetical protein
MIDVAYSSLHTLIRVFIVHVHCCCQLEIVVERVIPVCPLERNARPASSSPRCGARGTRHGAGVAHCVLASDREAHGGADVESSYNGLMIR